MKKSLLTQQNEISAAALQEVINHIKGSANHIMKKSSYGVTPIVNKGTETIIDYESLGDPTSCVPFTKTVEIFGVTIEIPLVKSKYLIENEKGEVEEKWDITFNYDVEQTPMVIKTGEHLFELSKLFVQHILTPMRGLSPRFKAMGNSYVTPTPELEPLLGKPYLDFITGHIPAGINIDVATKNKIAVYAQAALFKQAMAVDAFEFYEKQCNLMYDLYNGNIKQTNPISKVVSNVPYNVESVQQGTPNQVVDVSYLKKNEAPNAQNSFNRESFMSGVLGK